MGTGLTIGRPSQTHILCCRSGTSLLDRLFYMVLVIDLRDFHVLNRIITFVSNFRKHRGEIAKGF